MVDPVCPKCGWDRDIIKQETNRYWCPACWSSFTYPLGTPSKYYITET